MHKPGLLHQYTEVVQAWALLSVKCMDSEVCTDKFCTESESIRQGGLVNGTVPITRPYLRA
jgi:hypothetical protein